jgi:hypothetical protein
MGQILNFPTKKKYDNEDYANELSRALITNISATLLEFGFDPREPKLFDDLGVILNVINATVCRQLGVKHFMHEYLDVVSQELQKAAKEQHNDNH